MAFSVCHIAATVLDAFDVAVKVEGVVVEFDVEPAQSDAFPIDAGEVGFATDSGAKTTVEGVVPDVEFPVDRRVDGGDEVNRIVGHVHDVLVGPDAIEARHLQ